MRALPVVGIALVAFGLVVGFMPVTVGDTSGLGGEGTECGSAFIVNSELTDVGHEVCELSGGAANRRNYALGAIAAGIVLVLGWGLMPSATQSKYWS